MLNRYRRTVILLLLLNYTIFGITFYNAQSPILRILQQLVTFLVLSIWLFSLWRRKTSLPRTPLDMPLIALAFAWIIAALTSLDPRVSLEYTWPILVTILGLYLLVDLFLHKRERWLVEALFLTGAVIVLVSLLEVIAWYTGTRLGFGFSQGWPAIDGISIPPVRHRLLFLLNGTNGLGNFCAALVPLAITWAVTTRKRDLGIGAALLAGGLALTVYFSGSRGALLGLFVSSTILVLSWVRTRLDHPGIARWLGMLVRPQVFFGLAAFAAIAFAGVILLYTLNRPLRTGDANRIDLWQSSIDILHDYPLTGIGAFQFGHAQRLYGNPKVAEHQARHTHTHNIILQTMAEGGLITASAAAWCLVAFAQTWWKSWQKAAPPRRRRLEGGIAALAGFAAHNMVDTFTQIQFWVPILIIIAYTVYPSAQHLVSQRRTPERRTTTILLALLVAAEIAFIPIHLADLAHARVQRNLHDLPVALAEARTAQQLDPMLALYQMDEAYILGLLATEMPEQYLVKAIAAHEDSLARNAVWERGWHNLAALYALDGALENAVEAEQRAIDLLPRESGFHFTQGRYFEQLGNRAAAREAYTLAIKNSPDLLTSGYWTDPSTPERAQMLETIIPTLLEDTEINLRIATRADMLEFGIPFARTLDLKTASLDTLAVMGEWASVASKDAVISNELELCPECYYLEALERGSHSSAYYIQLAELALVDPQVSQKTGYTAEQLAQIALFIGRDSSRAWYVLALIAEQQAMPDEAINQYLQQAVPAIVSRQEYATVVFGRSAAFGILPIAQYPTRYERQYMPWLWLASRYDTAGETERLTRVYEAILAGEPYAWEIREQLAVLSQQG